MFGKGLQKNTYDERDLSFTQSFGAAQLPTKDFTVYDSFPYVIQRGDTLSAIAKKFSVDMTKLAAANLIRDINKIYAGLTITIPAVPMLILNQFELDFCTAFTCATLQYLLYGIPFDPYYQMAKTDEIGGSYTSPGATLRNSASSVTKYGSLPAIVGPYTHGTGGNSDRTRDFLANWSSYPVGLDLTASKYKEVAFYTVNGTYDFFDNIRSILSSNRRFAVSIGLAWHPEWTEAPGGIIPSTMPSSEADGHDMSVIGQKTINGTLYLVLQQSWGPNAGDHGLYYFPRIIIDEIFNLGLGSYVFSRVPVPSKSILGSIISALLGLFK